MMTAHDLTHMKRVLAQHPNLSIDGWRYESLRPDSEYSDEQFPRRRAMFMEPEYQEHVATALVYLAFFEISKKRGSYGLKHDIERWGRTEGLANYVTNGCAILAALMSGYKAVRQRNSPNCRLRIP